MNIDESPIIKMYENASVNCRRNLNFYNLADWHLNWKRIIKVRFCEKYVSENMNMKGMGEETNR